MNLPLDRLNLQARIDEIKNLDTSDIGSWSNFLYGFFAVLLFVAIVVLGNHLQVKPLRESIASQESQEKRLRKEFEEKQRKVANIDAYRDQLVEMRKSFAGLLRQLPSKTEVASLLNDISQTRVASGLEEELFQPEPDQPREFYAEMPNRITVAGAFHDIANFVSRVSALPRIVTIHEASLIPHPQRSGELQMKAIAKTYRYIEEDEAP
ncbi:MAG: type 4a pilus biogenesis protein PilO [Oceanococcaceae bacterium]